VVPLVRRRVVVVERRRRHVRRVAAAVAVAVAGHVVPPRRRLDPRRRRRRPRRAARLHVGVRHRRTTRTTDALLVLRLWAGLPSRRLASAEWSVRLPGWRRRMRGGRGDDDRRPETRRGRRF
jgi:hypothetical protein